MITFLLKLQSGIIVKRSRAREGVIIECPLIHLFHDARDVIITSRNNVRQLEDDDDDDEPTLGINIYINITLKVVKMTIYNVFDIPKRYLTLNPD